MPLPTGYNDLLRRLRDERADDQAVVRRLRDGGLPPVAAARALADLHAIPLGAAERRVHATGVWSDLDDNPIGYGT